MNFKKCARCGAFYLSEDNVCFNCKPKDTFEKSKVYNYLENVNQISSLEEIALNTGISVKNIARYLEGNPIANNFKSENLNNISINL